MIEPEICVALSLERCFQLIDHLVRDTADGPQCIYGKPTAG